ncbi:MAG TPA: GPP34 family phosphoprotein [Rhodanobacteraceae bacterium]
MLIAEQLVLLLLDPARGEIDVRHDATDPDRLAAAALLLDLAEQRNLTHRNGHVAFQRRFPSGHPLLNTAGDALASAGPGLPLAAALDLIETRVRSTARTLLEGLHRRDVLHRMRRPAWWPWAAWRYPLRSAQARNEAISVMRNGAARAPLREHGLLLLIDCAGRLPGFLDAAAHARATASLLALGHRREPEDAADALLGALRATLLED